MPLDHEAPVAIKGLTSCWRGAFRGQTQHQMTSLQHKFCTNPKPENPKPDSLAGLQSYSYRHWLHWELNQIKAAIRAHEMKLERQTQPEGEQETGGNFTHPRRSGGFPTCLPGSWNLIITVLNSTLKNFNMLKKIRVQKYPLLHFILKI